MKKQSRENEVNRTEKDAGNLMHFLQNFSGLTAVSTQNGFGSTNPYAKGKSDLYLVRDPQNQSVVDYAVSVFGNKEKALRWLSKPRAQFDGATPASMLATTEGKNMVENLLGQIEHGMFG